MNCLRLLLPLLILSACAMAQEKKYEMTRYVLGLLKKGPAWSAEVTEESKKIQAGHMANIQKMADSGKLIVAGPTGGGTDLRGILIFNVSEPDEVRAMVEADPALQSGRLKVELLPWFAAKGLKVDLPK